MKLESQELIASGAAIRDYQLAAGLSTAALIRAYPDLGSDKTYGKIINADLSEMDVETQLTNYRAVLAVIEAQATPDTRRNLLLEDLSSVKLMRRAILVAMRSTGSNRVVIVQGQSGIGKSTSVSIIARRYGSRVVRIEASEVWSDNPRALLGTVLHALGQTSLETSIVDRLEKVQSLLSESRRCLVIDEAHHLGRKCLNTIKTLVNTTPGEFVLVAIPTLWSKLESQAYMEARQLSTNRLSERLQLALTLADIEIYIKATIPRFPQEALKPAAKIIADHASRSGNFAFVRDVCMVTADGDTLSGETEDAIKAIASAVTTVAKRR